MSPASVQRLLAFASLTVVACAGADNTVVPPPPSSLTPPPPPSGTDDPAYLTINAYSDNQVGPAGSVLPIPLAVVVRAADGHQLVGVLVHFTVDSGGGSIANESATSVTLGVALAGKWTLGSVPGTQVLRASVTGLAPVKYHATAVP